VADESGIEVHRDGDVLRVVLARPESRNAQTPALWRALADVGESLDPGVRAVVLSAEGVSFSAGLDRRMFTPGGIEGEPSLASLAALPAAEVDAVIAEYQRAFTWWRECDAITVAAVQGHAVGAGFQLTLACDLIVVDPTAQFCMKEPQLGLVPDLAGTSPLVAAVGYPRALEICASGRWVTAEEALVLGIAVASAPAGGLTGVVDDLLAPMLGAMPGAITATKHLLAGAARREPADQRAAEREAQRGRLTDLMRALGGS
jgi:enoyl-CoA hydratase/carnithine racemase